jgi:hypothetical protein
LLLPPTSLTFQGHQVTVDNPSAETDAIESAARDRLAEAFGTLLIGIATEGYEEPTARFENAVKEIRIARKIALDVLRFSRKDP